MVMSREDSNNVFPFEALRTCKGPLQLPMEKVDSREASSSEQYIHITVWGPQGSGFEETPRRH